MLWPERPDNWRLDAKPAQLAFACCRQRDRQFEPVTMGVIPGHYANARDLLPDRIRVVEMTYNDAWMRDCGPTFVEQGRLLTRRGLDFNAWGGLEGGLYFPWDLDDLVAQKVAQIEARGADTTHRLCWRVARSMWMGRVPY